MGVAGGWSRRCAAAGWVLLQIIGGTQLVLVPVLVALLLAALLQPLAAALVKRGMPRALAAALVLLSGIAGIALLVWLVVDQFRNGLSDLTSQVEGGIDEIQEWLINGPLGLSQTQIDNAFESARNSLSENRESLTSGAVGAATTAGHVLTGLLIALFATFFLLKDGAQIWAWVVRLFPRDVRARANGAGHRAWHTLISYIRATLAVAFVDAVGIGVGAAVLGVPLALPLAVLVFLGSFIPIVGATVSGLVAVLVALVAKGPGTAPLAARRRAPGAAAGGTRPAAAAARPRGQGASARGRARYRHRRAARRHHRRAGRGADRGAVANTIRSYLSPNEDTPAEPATGVAPSPPDAAGRPAQRQRTAGWHGWSASVRFPLIFGRPG